MDESLTQRESLSATPGSEAASDAHTTGVDFVSAGLRAYARVRRALVAHKAETLAVCLLLLMGANLLSVIWRKTITNDEIVHIPAGYYHLVDGYFQLNNEHPPLVKMWAALPLLFVQPNEPPAPTDTKENFMERTWGYHARFWPDNKTSFEAIIFWTRVWMLPLTLALGALIFLFTRRLFNTRAALFALALFAFEPTMLAHGRVVHTDVPSACAYLFFFYALHRYVSAPVFGRALLLGVAAGVAFVTKFSMIVALSPILFIVTVAGLLFARRFRERRATLALHAIAAAAVVWFIVNAAYYFQSPPLEASDADWVRLKSAPVFNQLMLGFRLFSHLVPTYFLFGLYNVVVHNQYGHAASLLGMHSDEGWWYYFPVAYALKTTLPFLLASIAALFWSLWRLVVRREKLFLFLVVPFLVFTAFSLTSHINIGIRHFLPAFPLLFMMTGALFDRLLAWRRSWRLAATALVALTLAWHASEAIGAYPDYMPYMNELALSTHPRWYYLSDSNVEWGDDVNALAAYLRAHGETEVRGAMMGAWGTLYQYGIRQYDLISSPAESAKFPRTRYTAIGASFLNGSTVPGGDAGNGQGHGAQRVNKFAAYRTRTPEIVFGHSIYLFREE